MRTPNWSNSLDGEPTIPYRLYSVFPHFLQPIMLQQIINSYGEGCIELAFLERRLPVVFFNLPPDSNMKYADKPRTRHSKLSQKK